MVRICKLCKRELGEWQDVGALYCDDPECIKDVAKINSDICRNRKKHAIVRKKEALAARKGVRA